MLFFALLLLGAGVSPGAPPGQPEASTPKASVSQEQVEDWVRLWQQRLHLQDWKIDTRIVRSTELKPDTLGNLKWSAANRTAHIKVLDPIDYQMKAADVPEDMEYTVVHELVHLQLSVLPRDLGRKDVEETVVNKLSDALMLLEKGPSFRARSEPPAPVSKPDPEGAGSPTAAGRAAPDKK